MTTDWILLALWALLSLALGFLSPPALPASIASIAAFSLGLRKGARPLLALAFALQPPALVSASLERSLVLASTLMLASLYLAELGDLAARAGRSRDSDFVRRKALQVAAEAIAPAFDFSAAALMLAILVPVIISFKRQQ